MPYQYVALFCYLESFLLENLLTHWTWLTYGLPIPQQSFSTKSPVSSSRVIPSTLIQAPSSVSSGSVAFKKASGDGYNLASAEEYARNFLASSIDSNDIHTTLCDPQSHLHQQPQHQSRLHKSTRSCQKDPGYFPELSVSESSASGIQGVAVASSQFPPLFNPIAPNSIISFDFITPQSTLYRSKVTEAARGGKECDGLKAIRATSAATSSCHQSDRHEEGNADLKKDEPVIIRRSECLEEERIGVGDDKTDPMIAKESLIKTHEGHESASKSLPVVESEINSKFRHDLALQAKPCFTVDVTTCKFSFFMTH
ncbi:unnamed protein product [Protopolystoma xenopodis]|uniref:Uncharacterized protein n=1 Tax=Protopolystoma xenopodis TaxID=117903 RepID=A0A3S5AEP8_9PLAT|nr:unnamed protein product [Protopolystoma xenopodis]